MIKTIRFNIHGDNIIECERFVSLALKEAIVSDGEWSLETPSCPSFNVLVQYRGESYRFAFVLYPGFNKNTKKRWDSDVFSVLHECGRKIMHMDEGIINSQVGL